MKDKTDKSRVGVVGVGYLGRYHAEKFSIMEDVELVGVVDVNRAQSEEIATAFHTEAFQDYKDLFDRVDAVSIVTPTLRHFSIGKDFLEHDIDVMIEKPITETVDQAEELIQLAGQHGRILQIGHLERFNPAFVAVKDMVLHPVLIESSRKCIFKKRGTDVSVVMDMMIHDIDLVLSLVQSEITEMKAAGMRLASGFLDVATVHIRFAEGCVANLTASRIASANERRMDIFQPDARIAIDFSNPETKIVRKKEMARTQSDYDVATETRLLPKRDALNDELIAFVRSVSTRERPVVSGEMGRNALRTALDIERRIMSIRHRMSIDEGS